MDNTLSLKDIREGVRNEVSTSITSSLDTAIANIDWPAVLRMAQDRPAPSETGLARLNQWATARGDKPLGDDEVIHLSADGVEVFTASEIREHAVMRQAGILGAALTLDELGGLGVPFGSVLIGGFPGIIVGDVIDGFIAPIDVNGNVAWGNLLTKGAIAAGGAMFLPRWIGDRPAMFFAGALVIQMMSDMLPLDRLSAWVVGMFSRNGTAGASAADAAAAQARARARAQSGDIPIREAVGGNPILAALGV